MCLLNFYEPDKEKQNFCKKFSFFCCALFFPQHLCGLLPSVIPAYLPIFQLTKTKLMPRSTTVPLRKLSARKNTHSKVERFLVLDSNPECKTATCTSLPRSQIQFNAILYNPKFCPQLKENYLCNNQNSQQGTKLTVQRRYIIQLSNE